MHVVNIKLFEFSWDLFLFLYDSNTQRQVWNTTPTLFVRYYVSELAQKKRRLRTIFFNYNIAERHASCVCF